jgi:hypothetical protein
MVEDSSYQKGRESDFLDYGAGHFLVYGKYHSGEYCPIGDSF